MSVIQGLGRAAKAAGSALDLLRRALLNLLTLALLVLLVGAAWALWRSGPPPLQDKTALVLAPQGPIREQIAGSVRDQALQRLQGREVAQTRLRDVLVALEAGARDPKIDRLVLALDDFSGAGLPTLREVAAAIERFRASGKPVVAWGAGYDQRQYYLAAQADEVWMHPMGSVGMAGLGGWRNYYKDALDRLGVTAHVLRAGQFKNAAESFVASAPSPQTVEADTLLLGAMWAAYTGGVERARRLPAGSIARALDALPERLVAAGGNGAALAVREKWVDALKTRDEMRAELMARGAKDGETFRQVHFADYAARQPQAASGDAIGVIVAEGAIVDGRAGGGTVGGLSTSELIRRARGDERIKAVVLRVDSPGGSPYGSELVRRELELTRAAGKPVVVSMGDVAASGGYWVAMAADEVIADETTVTGSIGVVALLPTAERGLDRVGLRTGGVTTGWLVGAYDPRRGLDPRYARVVQAGVDHVYADFTGKIAAARKITREAVDAVGQGRVWTGAQARERGLVDRTGSLRDALAAASARAKLPADARVQYVEHGVGRLERLLGWLGVRLGEALGPEAALPAASPAPHGALAGVLAQALQDDLAWLLPALTRAQAGALPPAPQVHCLCTAPM